METLIEFKGLRQDGGGWVYGGVWNSNIVDSAFQLIPVFPESICQLIPHKVRIFCGDMVRFNWQNGFIVETTVRVIIWDVNEMAYALKSKYGLLANIPLHRAKNIVVVGNIHEMEVSNG